jgi:hypothetical protein
MHKNAIGKFNIEVLLNKIYTNKQKNICIIRHLYKYLGSKF